MKPLRAKYFQKKVIIFQTRTFTKYSNTPFTSNHGFKCSNRALLFEKKRTGLSHEISSEPNYTLQKRVIILQLQYLETNGTLLSLLTMDWSMWWECLSLERNAHAFLTKASKKPNSLWTKEIICRTTALRNKCITAFTSNNAFKCVRKVLLWRVWRESFSFQRNTYTFLLKAPKKPNTRWKKDYLSNDSH